jgi:hypothetical protein
MFVMARKALLPFLVICVNIGPSKICPLEETCMIDADTVALWKQKKN